MYLKLLAFTVTALLVFTGCNEKEEEKVQKSQVKVVKIFNVKNSSKFKKVVNYPAQVYAFQDTTMAFEVSGKIVKFYYKEGEKVKKGSIIAKLDDTIYKANYDSAKANYKQAQLDYKRYEKLYKTRSIAKIELERQKQNLDVTKALYQVAKKNLDETKLVAEFDGIMAKKMVNDFARVTAKQAIVRLQDNSSYKIKFFVPESDILDSKITELSAENISKLVAFNVYLGDDKNNKFQAKFIDISTTAEETTRTFEATLKIPAQKRVMILPGMTAQVEAALLQNSSIQIFIPYKAVFSDNTGFSFIWLVDDKNKVYKQQVQLGTVREDQVEIIGGLQEGARVVTSGVRFLEPNDEVKLYKKLGN